MDPRLLTHAERQAPRYTSYPSAPYFDANVDSDRYTAWLGDLSADAELSLYLHVPYCRTLCWYCGCNTYAARRDEPVVDYVSTLLREIDLVAARTPARRVVEIHWGGGTPNILSADQFARIHRHLGFWFDIDAPARHAIEIDPRHLSVHHAAAYAQAGVNRVSLGVQDINAHVQRAIGRVQPFEIIQASVETLRQAGIGDISIDLMYGLPAQSVEDVLASIRGAVSLQPQRIALFGYAHVPWFKKRQRLIDEQKLPGAAERFDQAEAARAELSSLGYIAIGLDHFALPDDDLAVALRRGELHRSFQGYVTGGQTALIGFGPSAISTLPQGYAQNFSEPGAWAHAITLEKLPCARGHELDEDDRRRRALIEQIMCAFRADLAPLGGAKACAREIERLSPLIADGLVSIAGDTMMMADNAHPFCRLAAQAFDAYAMTAPARHSRAV